jgi:hypothetical protein
MKEGQDWSGSRHCITELRPIRTLGNHPKCVAGPVKCLLASVYHRIITMYLVYQMF